MVHRVVAFSVVLLGKHVFHFANALAMHQFPKGHFVAGGNAKAPNQNASKADGGILLSLLANGVLMVGSLPESFWQAAFNRLGAKRRNV